MAVVRAVVGDHDVGAVGLELTLDPNAPERGDDGGPEALAQHRAPGDLLGRSYDRSQTASG